MSTSNGNFSLSEYSSVRSSCFLSTLARDILAGNSVIPLLGLGCVVIVLCISHQTVSNILYSWCRWRCFVLPATGSAMFNIFVKNPLFIPSNPIGKKSLRILSIQVWSTIIPAIFLVCYKWPMGSAEIKFQNRTQGPDSSVCGGTVYFEPLWATVNLCSSSNTTKNLSLSSYGEKRKKLGHKPNKIYSFEISKRNRQWSVINDCSMYIPASFQVFCFRYEPNAEINEPY